MIAAVAGDAVDGDAIVVWDTGTGALLHADDPDPDREQPTSQLGRSSGDLSVQPSNFNCVIGDQLMAPG